MSDARWKRVEELFERAAELPATARDEWLGRACGDDADLRAEVHSLLIHGADAAGALRGTVAAAAGAVASAGPATWVGAKLGPYRLLDVIGEGGMGTVYRAERDDAAYRGQVAIKILRDGLGSPEAIARFRDERQILATLTHKSIVKLLDGGTTEAGLPYLVMEHVDGVPLTTHARALPLRRRLELLVEVAGAIQHAHQQLIVHRDIKPGNILIDASGAPKLLDFGIAKLLEHGADREARTATGVMLFTVEYASPEQARGQPVSVATDVYALGAVLYDLLVGAPPQRRHDSMLETLRAICDVDPPRPSVAAPAHRRELAGDLDNIVMKALHKQPAARYASVAAFADDVGRYLDGRPVTARAATITYRAGKFARRHRGALALAALTAAALTTAAIVSIVQAGRANQQAGVARQQSIRAEAQTAVAEDQTRSLLIELGLRELATGRASRALPYFADVLRQGEDTPALRFLIAEASRPLARQLGDTFTAPEGISAATWSPDGATIALAGNHGMRLLDASLHVRATLDSSGEPVWCPYITSDGRKLIAQGNRSIMVWDVATGARLRRWERFGSNPVDCKADDLRVAGTDEWGSVGVWDLATGAALLELPPRVHRSVAVTDDGGHVFVGDRTGVIERWSTVTKAVDGRVDLGSQRALRLAMIGGGRLIAVGTGGTTQVFDAATLVRRATYSGDGDDVGWITIDLSRSLVATTGVEYGVRVWAAKDGQVLATLASPGPSVRGMAFSADGARLVTAGGDNTFRVWDPRTGAAEMVIESFSAAGDTGLSGALDAQFSPDGARLLTTSGAELKQWRVDREPLLDELRTEFALWAGRWSPDERRIAAVGFGATIYDATSHAPLVTLAYDSPRLFDVAWSPDGTHLVIAGIEYAAIYAADGRREHVLAGHHGSFYSSLYSPDGTRVLTAGTDRQATIWDAVTGAELQAFPHPANVMAATWNADGTRIVTAGWDRTLRVWDVATGQLVRAIGGGTTQFLHAALSPDGAMIASSGHDGEVTLWRVDTGARAFSLEGHTRSTPMVAWSPDGALLATCSEDGTVRVWDPATGRPLTLLPHPGTNLTVMWSRDGERLMSVGNSQSIRIWSVRRDPRSVADILRFADARSPWRLAGTRLVRTR